jgi:putative restriction endonuclease
MRAVRAYVGVTDAEWARHLASSRAEEVNFWRPAGDRALRALSVGELFFFKTHHPDNKVVGGGFFSGFASLTISEAWQIYGEANGASTLAEMRARVGRYRRVQLAPHDDPKIGCVFIRDVTFFGEPVGPPPDFAANVVQGKSYLLSDPSASPYFDLLFARLLGVAVDIDAAAGWHRPGPAFGDPRLAPNRLGQRAFQGVVRGAYAHRCSVTGDKIRPVLQAAHIRPLTRGGEHRIDNGLLLRSDVHTLFDAGYLAVDPNFSLVVSPRLRQEFGNGEEFYQRAASREPIAVPARRADRPAREFLEWHLDEIFLRS